MTAVRNEKLFSFLEFLRHIAPRARLFTFSFHFVTYLSLVDESFYDPRLNQILSKFSNTIDKNELRNADFDARERSALEWKQVPTTASSIVCLSMYYIITMF